MLEGMTKLQRMHKTIKREVRLIPRGKQLNSLQNQFRFLYYNHRMQSLSKRNKKKQDSKDVFLKSLSEIRKEHPDFTPKVMGMFKRVVSEDDSRR